jgi:hypothetical protein
VPKGKLELTGIKAGKTGRGVWGDKSPQAWRFQGGVRAPLSNKTAERFLPTFLGALRGGETPRREGSGKAIGFEAWGRLPPKEYLLFNDTFYQKINLRISHNKVFFDSEYLF